MQLQLLLTVAAAALAASTNAMPLSSNHLTQRSFGEASSSISPIDSQPARRSSSRRSQRAPSAPLAALINVFRRQGPQEPLMTAAAKKSLGGSRKRSSSCIINTATSTVPGVANTTAPGNATTASGGNATIVSTNGTVTVANVTVGPDGLVANVSSNSTIIFNNGTISKTRLTNTNSASTSSSGSSLLSVGYWAEWTDSALAPESIPWAKYDIMNYAFAIPNSDGTVTLNSPSLLTRMVKAAHAANVKLVLSIGGAGQSVGFVQSTADTGAINNFVKNLVALQKKYNLDGFDIDWEYPNNLIRRAATTTGQDTKNLQTFLQALRQALPSGSLITSAVPLGVWVTASGNSVGSVARAASALDYIFIMNYDVWGSSNSPGPNSPLANLCGNSNQPVASAAGAVKAWTAAGMPRNKMVLGLPMYGYINTSSKKTLISRALTSSSGSTSDGQINFNSIVSQGALTLSGDTYVAGNGWTKYWDNCSNTPYLSNGQIVVTYDDPVSLEDKAEFARMAGLAGAGVWSIDGDSSDTRLINSIRSGLQK